MEKEKWGDVKHKRLNIQRKTSEEISRSIYWFIYHWENSIYQYSQTVTTLMKICLVVNFGQVVRYREQVEEKKVEKVKLVEVNKVEE